MQVKRATTYREDMAIIFTRNAACDQIWQSQAFLTNFIDNSGGMI